MTDTPTPVQTVSSRYYVNIKRADAEDGPWRFVDDFEFTSETEEQALAAAKAEADDWVKHAGAAWETRICKEVVSKTIEVVG